MHLHSCPARANAVNTAASEVKALWTDSRQLLPIETQWSSQLRLTALCDVPAVERLHIAGGRIEVSYRSCSGGKGTPLALPTIVKSKSKPAPRRNRLKDNLGPLLGCSISARAFHMQRDAATARCHADATNGVATDDWAPGDSAASLDSMRHPTERAIPRATAVQQGSHGTSVRPMLVRARTNPRW